MDFLPLPLSSVSSQTGAAAVRLAIRTDCVQANYLAESENMRQNIDVLEFPVSSVVVILRLCGRPVYVSI